MSDDTLIYEPNPEATDEAPGAPTTFGTFAEDGTYTPRQITDDDLAGGFEAAIDGTLVSVEDGQLVEGTVVKVDRDEVLLDIGYKSEGVIPSRELSIRNDVDPNEIVSLGDRIEALVLTKEDKEGRLVLSKKRAQYERAWGDIERIKEEDGVVTGPVIEVVKGGFRETLIGRANNTDPCHMKQVGLRGGRVDKDRPPLAGRSTTLDCQCRQPFEHRLARMQKHRIPLVVGPVHRQARPRRIRIGL